MQKKVVLALVLVALVTGGVFADGLLSVGGGLLFDYSANNGVKYSIPSYGDISMGHRNLTIGGYGFFDATYVEVDVSFGYGLITSVWDLGSFLGSGSGSDGSVMQLGFSLLGKYPIEMSKKLVLFPLLGADYNLVLSSSSAGAGAALGGGSTAGSASELSQIGFLGGVGFDFGLTKALFLRTEALFHLRLAPKAYSTLADLSGGSTTLGMGGRLKVGVGYKL